MKAFLRVGVIGLSACAGVWAQAPTQPASNQSPPSVAPGAVPAGDVPAGARSRELPARILTFAAEPASIQPGQSVTLVWHSENPSGATIEPELGRVTPRGSRQIAPRATTTYTLTVRGVNNQVLTQSVTVNVAGTVPIAVASPPGDVKPPVPRTADGKPNLSGVYTGLGGGGAGRGAAPGTAPAGPVLKAGAEKFRLVRGPEFTGATSNCMPLIPPQSWGVPYPFQILQTANYIVIFHEYPGTFRIISTDGAPHQLDPDPSWLGDSVGRWEGETLVVDTIAFNEKTEIQGFAHTNSLHMIERFRRTEFDVLQYEVTIEDPNVFEKPFTVARNFSLRPEQKKIDEFICESNRDYRPLFGK